MAQQRRMIYSGIFANAELGMCSLEERYLYLGTIILADDDGKLRADARYLRGQIFSFDEKITSEMVQKMLENLNSIGQIQLYEREGIVILKHPNWAKYQRIRADMYVPSKLPSPVRTRNEVDTEMVPNISKDKLSKNKLNSEQGSLGEDHTFAVEIIKAMEMVDLKNKNYYKNITQRNAAIFLAKTYGLDEVLKRISILPRTNKTIYFPKIYSPVQLRDKWVDLEDAAQRKRSEIKNKPNVIFSS